MQRELGVDDHLEAAGAAAAAAARGEALDLRALEQRAAAVRRAVAREHARGSRTRTASPASRRAAAPPPPSSTLIQSTLTILAHWSMSATIETEVNGGLEGVVAFATEIAEPDRDGGALRYRGVDVEELVGRVPFEQVWGLLVDGAPLPGLVPARRRGGRRSRAGRRTRGASCRRRSRGCRVRPLIDLDADAGARRPRAARRRRRSSSRRSRARGRADGGTARRRRAPDARRALPGSLARRRRPGARPALDAYWITAAEHGMNASTFTARVVASTGADVARRAVGRRRRAVRPAPRRCARARADDARRGRARGRRDALRQARRSTAASA